MPAYSQSFFSKMFSTLFLFGLLFLINQSALALPGDVDPNFAATLAKYGGTIYETAVQPDGKIIIAGGFKVAGKYARPGIARLNANGTVDLTFNPPAVYARNADQEAAPITSLALQSNGKILIGGIFYYQGQERGLLRLNQDGSPDEAFNNKPEVANFAILTTIELYPDDRILASGVRIFSQNQLSARFKRLTAEGDLEAEIGANPSDIAIAPDGKLAVIFPGYTLARLNSDLSSDNSFQTSTSSYLDVAVQPDGKVIVVGNFNSLYGFPIVRIARFNTDGSVDSSFNTTNPGRPNDEVRVVKLLANGKILIGGLFTNVNGFATNNVALLNSDGSVDMSFSSQIPNVPVNNLTVQPDGKIIAERFRLNTNGSIDASFAPALDIVGAAYKILVQPDNKILAAGNFNRANEKYIGGLARFNADGSVDHSFNQTIVPNNNTFNSVSAIALQPDGKILVGGSFSNNVYRLNMDGSVDLTIFIGSTTTRDILVLPDGRIRVAREQIIQGFKPDGSPDPDFATVNYGTNKYVYKMVRQPADGKLIIAGEFNTVNNVSRNRIARINADGSVDATFAPNGGVNATIFDMALQADGKILIGGNFTGVNFDTNKKYLARLNTDGSLDTSFAPVINSYVNAIRLQPNGKILIGGRPVSTNAAPFLPGVVNRFNQDGTLDTSFNNAVIIDNPVNDIDLQQDKIIIGGSFSRVNGISNVALARLLNAAVPSRPFFDYDGDGRTDLSVFRPSNGFWYISNSSDNSFRGTQFGASGDLIAPADYDGDGKTDLAVFRPSDGVWYLLQSSAGFAAAQFGTSGDVPVPGDFDGDGKANLAVFRPSTGSWYIARPTGIPSQNFDTIVFGLSADKPLVADFDGDGRIDIAVYRPSDGGWYRLNSSNGQFVAAQFGIAEDKPVPADYDGDGKANFAVYRPSAGSWYIARPNGIPAQNFDTIRFGISSDLPASGDFDGDGRADTAVYRPSEGIWYLLRSTAGFTGYQFGTNGDIPTPNAFVR